MKKFLICLAIILLTCSVTYSKENTKHKAKEEVVIKSKEELEVIVIEEPKKVIEEEEEEEVVAIVEEEVKPREKEVVEPKKEVVVETPKVETPPPATSGSNVWFSGDGSFKAVMDYRAITSRGSKQWSCLYNEGNFQLIDGSIANVDGILKTHDGYIAVAMGSHFGNIGSKFKITTSHGNSFNVIKVDSKADIHTDANNIVCLSNGSIVEFVVDTHKLKQNYSSWWDFNGISGFSGSISRIERLN